MKKKMTMSNLTNIQMNKICRNHPNCVECPLKRTHMRDGKERTYNYCFKNLRALYYSNLQWYKNNPDKLYKGETLEERLTELLNEEQQIEQIEIEIEEGDLI